VGKGDEEGLEPTVKAALYILKELPSNDGNRKQDQADWTSLAPKPDVGRALRTDKAIGSRL